MVIRYLLLLMSLLSSSQLYAVQDSIDKTTPYKSQWIDLQTFYYEQGYKVVNIDMCSLLEIKHKLTCKKIFFKPKNLFDKNSLLKFSVSIYKFENNKSAKNAYDQLFLSADINTGLTYAWDYILVKNNELYWLHAGCYFSEKNWINIYSNLTEYSALYASKYGQTSSFKCRCGFGCKKSI